MDPPAGGNDRYARPRGDASEGIVVPISVLTKEPRRNFSLRDESGRAIPVLGKAQNGDLAHMALLSAAWDALPEEPPLDVLEMLSADLRQVVTQTGDEAFATLIHLRRAADAGDRWRGPIFDDPVCSQMLWTLSQNYVLFAVLPPDGANRRILKYSYSEDFTGELGRPLCVIDSCAGCGACGCPAGEHS
jgi:hypothetical protein